MSRKNRETERDDEMLSRGAIPVPQDKQEKLPAHGITYDSMKRGGKFMIAAIIVFILSLMALFGYQYLYNSSIINKERACWLQEQRVEQLAQKYMTSNGFSSLPAYVEDIPGFSDIQADCPSGGSYTWNPVNGEYTCSEHQHYPDGFNGAKSVNEGTTVSTVEKNG